MGDAKILNQLRLGNYLGTPDVAFNGLALR